MSKYESCQRNDVYVDGHQFSFQIPEIRKIILINVNYIFDNYLVQIDKYFVGSYKNRLILSSMILISLCKKDFGEWVIISTS